MNIKILEDSQKKRLKLSEKCVNNKIYAHINTKCIKQMIIFNTFSCRAPYGRVD